MTFILVLVLQCSGCGNVTVPGFKTEANCQAVGRKAMQSILEPANRKAFYLFTCFPTFEWRD